MRDRRSLRACTTLSTVIVFIIVQHINLKCAIAESVTVVRLPKESGAANVAWSWRTTGPSGDDQWVNSWFNGDKKLLPQYSICAKSPSTQPNQWLISKYIDVRPANRIDITIEYAMMNCSDSYLNNHQHCRQTFSLYIHKSANQLVVGRIPDPFTNLGAFEKVGTLIPKVLSFGALTQAKNKETFPVMTDAAKPYVYLAFHYKGGCVSLFSVSVHYYRCPAISLTSNLVQLSLTTAPANGSVHVKGSCSQYTKPLTNESDIYGYCEDDGEWSTDLYHGECGCDYGYGKFAVNDGSECRECPSDTYKNTVSNSNCTTCPLNSIQDTSRTSCNCEAGFYRTDKETTSDNCTGQPSAPQNLSIGFFNATIVSMTWSVPSDDGGRSDVYYTVECKQCNDQGTDCTIECTYPDITVNQNAKLASIKRLSSYTYYQFKVYANNGVSKLAEKNNEKAKYVEKTLRTKEAIPGRPVVIIKQLSPTSVFLSWELQEENGVIKYYLVSYLPVDQPSNVKRFNTTHTNATITGLETGKEYRFQVQASSRLGIGQPASQTITMVGVLNNDKSTNAEADVIVPVLGTIVGLFFFFAFVVIVYFVRKERIATARLMDQKQAAKFELTPKSMNDGNLFLEGFDHPLESRDEETQEPHDNPYMVVSDDVLWETPRENISVIKRLGSGNFGYVDKALAIGIAGNPGQVTVAVKSLKEGAKAKDKEDFLTELRLMMRMAPHRHVVRLYGCCTKSGGPQCIILEYLPYGDLLGYLRRSRGHEDSYCSGELRPESSLKSNDLLRFGWMIADGMNFLEENRCVHRDLAARNVLVGENIVCKISDLGLARKLITDDIYTRSSGARLPVKWMPPESLFFGQSTIASDVWAYGIVLWELFTLGDSPYPGFKGKDVPKLLREGYRMPKPPHLSKILYSLMLRCWNENPKDRPSFGSICEEINTYLEAKEDYINLDVYDDSLYVNFDVIKP